MDRTGLYFKRLGEEDGAATRKLFASVFTEEPWNDDWSDGKQLEAYLHDLTGQSNSLAFGLYEGSELVCLSLGRVKHWYTGAEYCIDEFCVQTARQGQGLGGLFMEKIEAACKDRGMTHIFLLTDRDVPAYGFYRKLGFYELESNVAFAKKL